MRAFCLHALPGQGPGGVVAPDADSSAALSRHCWQQVVAGAEGWVDMSTRAARPCRPADVALFAELGAQDSSLLQQELGLDLGRQQLRGPRVNPTRDFQAGAIYKAEVHLLQKHRTVHLSLPCMQQHRTRVCRGPALKLVCVVPPVSCLLPDCCTLQVPPRTGPDSEPLSRITLVSHLSVSGAAGPGAAPAQLQGPENCPAAAEGPGGAAVKRRGETLYPVRL